MIVEAAIPTEGNATSTVTATEEQRVQTMLDQLMCPECPWGPFESKQLLQTHRFNAHNVRSGGPAKSSYKRTARGTFICPECGQDDFQLPLLVGRHRFQEHGYTNPNRVKPKKKPQPKAITVHHDLPTYETPRQGPDPSELYMFARIEAQLEAYAKDNGLLAKPFIKNVAELLLGAVA